GQREQSVLFSLGIQGVAERGERAGGILAESRSEIEALEHLIREAARLVDGERAGGQVALEVLGRGRGGADRRRACCGGEEAGHRDEDAQGPPEPRGKR